MPTTNTLSEAAPPAESTIVPEIVCPAIESDSVCEGTVNENTALLTDVCAAAVAVMFPVVEPVTTSVAPFVTFTSSL